MSTETRKLAELRRLAAQIVNSDDPTAVVDLLVDTLQPAKRGPKPKSVRRLRLDRHPPRSKIEGQEWVQARLSRFMREHEPPLKALPAAVKRPLVIQLIAEVERMTPGLGLNVDYFMRRHQ
jgi:hypothetical protein